jgi:hypothetical protein
MLWRSRAQTMLLAQSCESGAPERRSVERGRLFSHPKSQRG